MAEEAEPFVGDVVDMEAAQELQNEIAQLFQGKPLSMVTLVLANEIANTVLLRRPTLEKAHQDVDRVASYIRSLVVVKAKYHPELIDHDEPKGPVN